MRFSFVAGVGINYKSLDSKLICSYGSCSFDIPLIYFFARLNDATETFYIFL